MTHDSILFEICPAVLSVWEISDTISVSVINKLAYSAISSNSDKRERELQKYRN